MKKSIIFLLTISILSSCKDSKKNYNSNEKLDISKLEFQKINTETLPLELNAEFQKTIELNEYQSLLLKIGDIDNNDITKSDIKTHNPIDPSPLKMISERVYTGFAESYRGNLDELMGKLLVENNNGSYDIASIFSIKKNDAKIKSEIPKNGKLLSLKVTKDTSSSITLFLNASVSENTVSEYHIADISRTILKEKEIDTIKYNNLKKGLKAEHKNLNQYKIIIGATVTEIYSRDYFKKERKLKASDVPLGSLALSFDNTFFVSDENMKRQYKVGLITMSLGL